MNPTSEDNSEAWWESKQMRAAVAAVAGGVLALLTGLRIVIPYNLFEVTLILSGSLAIFGGGIAAYRRIRVGLNPCNDAKRVTLL